MSPEYRRTRTISGGTSRVAMLMALVLGVVILAGAVVWGVGPIRPFGETVTLLALGSDGTFGADVRLEPDSTRAEELRLPLILGLQNQGGRAVRPVALHLSIPARYRLLGADSIALIGEPGDGGPLVRYSFPLPAEEVEPAELPAVMPGTENLRLAFARPSITCRLDNGVPVFAPAPPYPPEQLSTIEAFWAIETAAGSKRHAGTVRFSFDPDHVAPLRPSEAVFGPVAVDRPDVTLPRVAILALEGVRETTCGEPGRAEPLRSTVWRTPRGRFLLLSFRGSPRKQLFDLNGDSSIELEAWDIDGDGHFEARRNTSFRIPDALLPAPPLTSDSLVTGSVQREPSEPDTTPAGTVATDTAERDTSAADRVLPDTVATDTLVVDTVAADTLAADTVAVDTLAADTVAVDTLAADTIAVDTLAVDTIAVDTIAVDTVAVDTVAADALAADTVAVDTVAADTVAVDTAAAGTLVADTVAADTLVMGSVRRDTIPPDTTIWRDTGQGEGA